MSKEQEEITPRAAARPAIDGRLSQQLHAALTQLLIEYGDAGGSAAASSVIRDEAGRVEHILIYAAGPAAESLLAFLTALQEVSNLGDLVIRHEATPRPS